ncbi:MAG: formimidoylglutamase [Coxiellaceae bacterium]|nr:formimidoylglutamase [Coxiellaceae bacterium]
MNLSHYTPPNKTLWQGREDDNDQRLFKHINTIDLQQPLNTCADKTFALLGFCCDEGVRRNHGRIGAAQGPFALRQSLANLPMHKPFNIVDAGDIHCQDEDLAAAQQQLGLATALLIEHGYQPILIGGGHEIAWGHYQGLVKANKTDNLAIINFDAHFDMRPLLEDDKGSSGTPFLQVADHCKQHDKAFNYSVIGTQFISNTPTLYETAKQNNVNHFSAQACIEKPEQVLQYLQTVIDQYDAIYMTVCMDVLSAAFAPGVSAVNPAGVAPWHIRNLIRLIARSNKLVSCDIAELSPCHDQQQLTAKCAANILSEVLYA